MVALAEGAIWGGIEVVGTRYPDPFGGGGSGGHGVKVQGSGREAGSLGKRQGSKGCAWGGKVSGTGFFG